METINGEWYMKGCDPEAPGCVHNTEELVKLIKEIGFLPLFSNMIENFSVEEHTVSSNWWSDDSENDPWIWRQILSSHPDIAYGKFFGHNTGFISKEWFPVFANYRRNGYDFDALYDDELASVRSKKIMDAFELDDNACGLALMTNELRDKAGRDDKALTDLQMQTYLIVSDFRQRKNKKGQLYGWHLAVLSTPETKWSYDYVSSGYKEDPEESWNKIMNQLKKYFPSADDSAVRKLLGIRYPGADSPVKKQTRKTAKENTVKSKPKELPYPGGLLITLGIDNDSLPLNEDQSEGLRFVLEKLNKSEHAVILLRFQDHMTYKAIGELYGLSLERVRQIYNRAIKKLKKESLVPYYRDGYVKTMLRLEEEKQNYSDILTNRASAAAGEAEKSGLLNMDIKDMDLSARTANCLTRSGINTLNDLLMLIADNPLKLTKIRNLGRTSYNEILSELEKMGIRVDLLNSSRVHDS